MKTYIVKPIASNQLTFEANSMNLIWEKANEINDFSYPCDNERPPKTTFRALHDDNFFYFRFDVEDENVLTYVKEDHKMEVLNSDRVEIFFRQNEELDPYFCYSLLKYYKSWNIDTIKKLLETLDSFNFEYKALLKYLQYISTYENIGISEALGYLDDYSKQSLLMVKNKKKIEKYPKYIKSKHDIVSKQYNIFKTSYNDEIFADMYIGRNFEYSDNKYSVIIPSKTEDIKEEGMELNHCIKSYIDGVLEGKYHIVFMRLSKELDQSFISMQIKDNVICQCKGSMNRCMTLEELKFINKYAKTKKFKVSENL